jgi:phosphate uptake regulator
LFTLRSENESADLMEAAQSIITADSETNMLFREFLEQTIAVEEMFHGRLRVWYDLTALGRSLERIGDLCTNIAKDAIFMFSGEIVRHDLANLGEYSVVDG